MPFGFWVLGNDENRRTGEKIRGLVSNAFRLLGSGEHQVRTRSRRSKIFVSNAFRLLGSGERNRLRSGCLHAALESQMPFGFWVLGNSPSTRKPGSASRVSNAFRLLGSGELSTEELGPLWKSSRLKCLSAFGFWGTRGRNWRNS